MLSEKLDKDYRETRLDRNILLLSAYGTVWL